MKKIVSILLALAMVISLMPASIMAEDAQKFSDVNGTEYFAAAAEALTELKILAGYPDGTFGAEKSISRAEMAAIVCRMTEKEEDAKKAEGKTQFEDVAYDHWASGYINVAASAGIIAGYEGKFRPEDEVKYEEAVKMIVCTAGLEKNITANPSDWSKPYLDAAKNSGLLKNLKGDKGNAATRGDIAVMTYNALVKDLKAPTASKPAGSYSGTQSVELTTETKDAVIYYTTDGSAPTTASAKYTKAISVGKSLTLRAIAVLKGVLVSDELNAVYTIAAISSGGGGGGSSKYTVSFNLNYDGAEGTPEAQKVKRNEYAQEPEAPTRDGYEFTGWYTEKGCTNKFDFENTKITKSVALYAGWKNVEFDPEADEDGDNVDNFIEGLFGTDSTKDDTDGDGLSDYIEIYKSDTDPILKDTDENGVEDGDEDLDGDGLTNLEEVKFGTSLRKVDTDMDGLNDYDEINVYLTDPLNVDTDEDGLLDGDEVLLDLDPLTPKSDGKTPDSERTFEQTVDEENISEELLTEDNAAIPSLSVTASGNINRTISIEKTKTIGFSDSRAIVGEPIDISGADLSNSRLSFEINEAEAAMFEVEDVGEPINLNLICRYGEDGNTYYYDTDYDPGTSSLSADIDSEGTYFLLDVQVLFDELGLTLPSVASISSLEDEDVVELKDISENNANTNNAEEQETASDIDTSLLEAYEFDNYHESETEEADASKEKITLMAASAMAQADIVFVIDTTGSMSDEINNVKNNITEFVDALKDKGVSAGLALVEYRDIEEDGYDTTKVHKNSGSNWFYDMDAYKSAIGTLYANGGGDDPESVVDALETARRLDMRASAGKIFVLVTDANYKVANRYEIPSMAAEIELLKNAGINCSVVSANYLEEVYRTLYTDTNGIFANIYGDFYTELMTLADKIGEEIVGDGYWIYLDGPIPVPVRLDEEPYEGSNVDTDEDGIPDVEELASYEPTKEIDLDEIVRISSKGAITGTDYGKVMMYEYKSSPVEEDTDYDGSEDAIDSMPKSNTFKGKMHYKLDDESMDCNVEFTVDYRDLIDGDNKKYSKDLSVLSIIYASDVYDGTYIEFTEGASGGSDDGTILGEALGLKDTKYVNVRSKDNIDADDITDFFVGHKNINYSGNNTEVIVVAVRGTNGTNEEWSSNFDVGASTDEYYEATGYDHPDWINHDNHKGFDVTANRVLAELDDYIDKYINTSSDKCILITGHSRGAAIANIIGKEYEERADFKSFTYTFATPNNTLASNASTYETIFNIVNEDDLIPHLPIFGFTKYGNNKTISVTKEYENKWWTAEKGTWEWLIGRDYNNDGGTSRTLSCFSKIATSRDELYKIDTSNDGKVWENNLGHITYKGAQEELDELTKTLQEEKLLRFCNLTIVGGELLAPYHVEVNYCPAYLMQTLCNMTTSTGPRLGHDVKGKYASAKASFVASSGKVVVGGMTDPHMSPTYYLIAYNDFKKLG